MIINKTFDYKATTTSTYDVKVENFLDYLEGQEPTMDFFLEYMYDEEPIDIDEYYWDTSNDEYDIEQINKLFDEVRKLQQK